MLNVTEQQKQAYNGNSIHKTLRLYFPNLGLTISNNKIYESSMKLKESLIQGNNIEFVGCIASMFSIQVYDVPQNLKGQKIEVYIKTDDTAEIPLFKGIVDSAKMQTNRKFKDITAYDELYTKGQIDVAGWYNNLAFPITLGALRNSLFSYIGLTQENSVLPNDDIVINKEYEPKLLKCLTVMKSICQLNGCFGIINRNGNFEYRYIYNKFDEVYPAATLYPSFIPVADHSGTSEVANSFPFYKKVDYEEFVVKPVERLQIRQNEEDSGVTVGNPSGNKYVIQNNMFAYNLPNETLKTIGNRVFEKVANITFHPCDTDNNGLPYVEVGDVVDYALPTPNTPLLLSANASTSAYDVNSFNVMSREITGIQALRDNYEASGEEEQSEFITDIQAQIDAIKRGGVDLDNYYTKEETAELIDSYEFLDLPTADLVFDDKISEMEVPTGFNIVSCYVLPTSRQANTLYCVQGLVTML